MKRLSLIISRDSLQTIYQTLFRSQFYCADIIYEKTANINSESKLESVQYNACLAITGTTIQGTNKDIIYTELGLDHS